MSQGMSWLVAVGTREPRRNEPRRSEPRRSETRRMSLFYIKQNIRHVSLCNDVDVAVTVRVFVGRRCWCCYRYSFVF